MNQQEEQPPKKAKASFPEKAALFLFVLIPLLRMVLVQRIKKWFNAYLKWCGRNINLLITINMIIVLAGMILLLALQLWLSHVRGW